MFPMYQEIEKPLVEELRRRGGKARLQDKGPKGRNVYDALADHFNLTKEERDACIYENGKPRSKWHNMVRYAVRSLRDAGVLKKHDQHGIWEVAGKYLP